MKRTDPQFAQTSQGHMRHPLLVCGKGEIAVFALRLLAHLIPVLGLNRMVVACPNSNDQGQRTWEPSLRTAAETLGLPIRHPLSFADNASTLLLSLEYDQLLPVDQYATNQLFNIHFSLLPAYRGVYTSILPILHGEQRSGVTLHMIASGIDNGPIIAQQGFALHPRMTARELYARYMTAAKQLLVEHIRDLLGETYNLIEQNEAEASLYYRKDLDIPSESRLDLTLPAEELDRRVRAFSFPEYQMATLNSRPVVECQVVDVNTTHSPASLILSDAYSATYAVGNGDLVQFIFAD